MCCLVLFTYVILMPHDVLVLLICDCSVPLIKVTFAVIVILYIWQSLALHFILIT